MRFSALFSQVPMQTSRSSSQPFTLRHVLFALDPADPAWESCVTLAQGLVGHGVRATFAALGTESPRHEEIGLPGIECLAVDNEEIVSGLGADAVVVTQAEHASLPWQIPSLLDYRGCSAVRWRALRGDESADTGQAERFASEARGLRRADMVVAQSEAALRQAEAFAGPLQAMRVLPLAAESTGLDLYGKRDIAVTLGSSDDEASGLELLDAACEGGSWPVYVGDTAGKRGQWRNLSALGRLCSNARGAWLGRASMYIHPALHDPSGHDVLEAAAAGCALVLADDPCLKERWNEAASFFPRGDVKALREALRSLARDPERRNYLAVAARERAASITQRDRLAGMFFALHDVRQACAGDAVFRPSIAVL